jgi:predicted small lipoprotein YifL
VLLALALTGCGRRGALEPPPGSQLGMPSSGPVSPSLDAAATGNAVTTTPATPASGEPAKPAKPKLPLTKPMFKSFFLDPLVN